MTINSGRLLDTRKIDTVWQPVFATTMVAAVLLVFRVTDPKLNEVGANATSTWNDLGTNTESKKTNPRDRDTRSVFP